MRISSILLQNRSKTVSIFHRLSFVRSMGGGPRTFPGGVNKWQWKRMHEKKAREKENRLLDQERQIYHARIRSDIRAKLASKAEDPRSDKKIDQGQPNYGPMSPQELVKALADRFVREGAEDLWNEADGPVKNTNSGVFGEPVDLKKLISEKSGSFDDNRGGFSGNFSDFSDKRHFSTYSRLVTNVMSNFRNEDLGRINYGFGPFNCYGKWLLMSTSKLLHSRCCCYSVHSASMTRSKRFNFGTNDSYMTKDRSISKLGQTAERRVKWPRFRGGKVDSSEDDSDEYDEEKEEEEEEEKSTSRSGRIVGSSAALGKYDSKSVKRVPLNTLGDDDDLSLQVETVRKEVGKRSLQQEQLENGEHESILGSKRFDEYNLSLLSVRALTEAGYAQMTRVQEATISVYLEGKDALVKARTGTGKSIAFLLPAIETVLKASSSSMIKRVPLIHVLILCPTRELASQIAAEANVLLKYHDGIGVQTLIGGTRFKDDQRRLESDSCQIIVATPGRLLDHVENKSGLSVRLMGLKMLILDEADHLLDLGFRKDMEKIVDCLPRQRQSLLLSATIPKEVRRVSQLILKREHTYIDTVGLGCLETHEKVKQFYFVAPHEQHFQIVHHLLKSHISQALDYKVIVFCTTAMMTSLMFSLFREMKLNVREIHSRKPQSYRTRISDEFKESKSLILITSDVSARGMHYPDVTLVIQVGIPPDRGQYIHRLGRTGRQGKEGEGFLLLAPWEEYFLDEIKDLPVENRNLLHLDPDAKVKIDDAMKKIDNSVKEAAYHSWLGYYNSINAIGRDKTSLVQMANRFSESIGLEKPPALFRKTALKMGLKDIPGIRVRK